MKKKIVSLSCLLFASSLFVSLAAGAVTRSNAVEVKASADDNSYYYIVGDFAYETSNSEYKSLGSWNTNYNDAEKELAGVQNHHSKIYTLTGGWYLKSENNWVSYEDNFNFYDLIDGWGDKLSFNNVVGSAKDYFTTNSDGNIVVNKAAFYSGTEDGAKLTYSIRPDVTATSKTLTIENVYYYAGTEKTGWHPESVSGEIITLVENGPKQLISFAGGEEFKFTNWNRNPGRDNAWYNTLDFSKLDGNATSSFESAGDNNIKCYNAGQYFVSVSDSKLIIDYADYCYRGTATSWGQDDNHTIRVGGNPVSFTFAKDEGFKITPKLAGSTSEGDVWGKALDWDDLTGSVETIDGVNYRSYRCFKMGTGTDNLNIICRRAGTYLVSINSNLKVTIVASNQDQTNTYYALDLNGDLFTGDSKSPYAHLFINDSLNPQVSTQWPGIGMTKVDETKNIFAIDAWVDLNAVVFNNGSTGTIDLSLTGNENKVLILSWAFDETANKWTSNKWLSLDAAKFIDSYMKFETDHEDNTGSGKCKTDGWYTSAKNAFNALSEELREEILSYELVNLRLNAWAAANGDTINNSSFISNKAVLFSLGSDLIENNYIVFIVIGTVGLVGAYLFLRRRKKD